MFELPGADVGVTWQAYRRLCRRAGVVADFMIDELRVTFAGRVCRRRGSPALSRRGVVAPSGFSPFGPFRVRRAPLRQEPEWQLDNKDVARAWRRLSPNALLSVSPSELYIAAEVAVQTLGRWPRLSAETKCWVHRTEKRLALLLRAFDGIPCTISGSSQWLFAKLGLLS